VVEKESKLRLTEETLKSIREARQDVRKSGGAISKEIKKELGL